MNPNGLGEMLTALDSKSNAVKLSYDLSGKRTSLESPDSGKVILSYDEAGNLATKTDSALRGRGEVISYEYDGLERLVKVKYPRTTATQYYFGEAGAANGGAGRLVRRTDASGTVNYEYGSLGETTAMTRSLDRLTPLAENLGARFEYVSDYLGRMQRISYPDGEILSYGYDTGGQLKSATSEHNGLSTTYVADIAYDAFGQRTYIEYGNGVRTSYAYDENRRWLSTIKTDGSMGTTFQNMSYRFDLVGNVSGYANSATGYETKQSYYYDGLYQLTKAEGRSISRPLLINEYTSNYTQNFSYDSIGNMTKKASSCLTSPSRAVGDDLNYTYDYSYFAGKAHQAERIGNRYYRYDANGNMIEEREGGHGTSEVLAGTVYQSGDLRMTDTGFGIVRQASGTGGSEKTVYCRNYAWDEENRLIRSADNGIAVDYRYGADGQRTAKYSSRGESMYFDSMWAVQTDGGSLRQMKNVYIAQTRIATRLTISGEETTGYERQNTYYYHPDHLGSAQLVTDYQGKEYERIEYTPYGESWIEKTQDGLELLPYKFTGKELDSETGLYYYGARYLNPKTSAWISADPALGDYIPMAPIDEEARKQNGKLPGMGGVFNPINFALYHYAGNNPVKYVDPDGRAPTVIISPGHGMNAPGQDRGAVVGKYVEVDYVYSFSNKLYASLDAAGVSYVNLKQYIENNSGDHSPPGRVRASDAIFGDRKVSLEMCIHADSNTKGYEGITMMYIAGHPESKKIAQFFADKLSAAGFKTQLMPDNLSDKKRNAELRDTKARAALIEIGSLDTADSRKAMVGRMDLLATTLADAIKAFNAGEADK